MHDRPQVEPILTLIREAGALVRTMQRQVSLSVKQDGTVVTEADISAHNLIVKSLKRFTPDIPIISEEQSASENEKIFHSSPEFWAVDPLDVTVNYAGGGNTYSINIALVQNGIPVLGVLYFPGLEELYYTNDHGKAYKQIGKDAARTIHVAPIHAGVKTAAVRPHDHATHIPVSENTLKVIFTRGQRRACLVASGEATFCSERSGFRIWDSAATYAIIHAAGGALRKENGEALLYNVAFELPAYFVGHPELLSHLHAVKAGEAKEEPITPKKNARTRSA